MIGRVCLAAVLGLASATLAAQDNSAKVRLDEFAGPASATGVIAEQVTPSVDEAIVSDQKVERLIEPDQAAKTSRTSVSSQVSTAGPFRPVNQVSPLKDRNAQPSEPLSRRADGLSVGTERLIGDDRCDPQAKTAAAIALCKRVIELRAREYSATEAPILSAEQELLARQSSRRGGMLADFASIDRVPDDADERAAQELGFLALTDQAPLPAPEEGQSGDGDLGEALKGILVQMGVPQP